MSVRVSSTRKRKQGAAKDKVVVTSKCPGWLVAKPDKSGFDVIEEHAETVRQIFQWAADGVGVLSISRRLNEGSYPRWGIGKQGWSQAQVFRLLESPAVEGDYIPNLYNPKKENGGRIVATGTGYGYVVCLNARLRAGCDRRAFFRYRPFEDAALQTILHLALDDRFFHRPDETARLAVAAAEAEKLVSGVQERMRNRSSARISPGSPRPFS